MTKIAKPIEEPNFTFILGNATFKVDFFKFGCYSKLFQDNQNLYSKGSYEVQSKVSKKSFNTFLKACNGDLFILNQANAYEFITLCKEFQADEIMKLTENFVKSNEIPILINELEYKKRNGISVLDTYAQIAKLLPNFTNEQFYSVFTEACSKNDLHSILSQNEVSDYDKERVHQILDYLHERKMVSEFLPYFDFTKLREKDFPLLEEASKKRTELEKNVKNMETAVQVMQADFENLKQKITAMSDKYKKLGNQFEKMSQSNGGNNSSNEDNMNRMNNEIKKMDEEMSILWIQKNPFKGIIYNLQQEFRNADSIPTDPLEIRTPENITTNNFKKTALIEYENEQINNCYYQKVTTPNDNWIDFNFGGAHKVFATAITIRTNNFGPTFSHPKAFRILGSMGNSNWETILEVSNADELNGMNKCHTYIFPKSDKPYDSFRYLQLDTHFPYKDRKCIIALSAIEIFGRRELNRVSPT